MDGPIRKTRRELSRTKCSQEHDVNVFYKKAYSADLIARTVSAVTLLSFVCQGCVSGHSEVVRGADKPKEIIARVLDQDIYRRDLGALSIDDDRCRELAGRVMKPLIESYRKQRAIHADEGEIEACLSAWKKMIPADNMPPSMAEEMIVRWKTDRSLYQQYGGAVIFQQANPYEPVGAYRAFLQERESAGDFEIYDPEYARCFWLLFPDKPAFSYSRQEVDFSVPWWIQMCYRREGE
jgi:hypothetical protein